jgi:hypothetical protein
MEVSGQVQALAALPTGRSGPQSRPGRDGEEKKYLSAGNGIPVV